MFKALFVNNAVFLKILTTFTLQYKQYYNIYTVTPLLTASKHAFDCLLFTISSILMG